MLEKVEYAVFFPLVRIFTFISASILFLAMLICLVLYLTTDVFTSSFLGRMERRVISFSEISESVHKEEVQVKIPRNIQKRLNANTSQVLDNWLNSFSTAKEKNDFLQNLSQIIAAAEKNDPKNVDMYINNFRDLYMEGIREKARMDKDALGIPSLVEKYVSPWITRMIRGAIALGMICLFTLFVITVALLSLLSIERNTR